MSVGVLRHATPLAGVVIEFVGGPVWTTRTYSASRNGGAFLNGARMSVSGIRDLADAVVVSRAVSPARCLSCDCHSLPSAYAVCSTVGRCSALLGFSPFFQLCADCHIVLPCLCELFKALFAQPVAKPSLTLNVQMSQSAELDTCSSGSAPSTFVVCLSAACALSLIP